MSGKVWNKIKDGDWCQEKKKKKMWMLTWEVFLCDICKLIIQPNLPM